MALDKQMILSELGSVMNKLQSADCGCMGKLFSNQGQYSNQGGQGGEAMGSQLPTCGGCRRGCCHGHGYGGHSHGYSAPCAGEPYNNSTGMGMQCNPAKMYAETYNYLNSNLMQPVVQEVYHDLKSINPNNSVINNSDMARKMGLQHPGGGTALQENAGMAQNQMSGSGMGGKQNPNMPMNQQMGNHPVGNQQMADQHNNMSSQPMSQMGGMGPNILNMFQGGGSKSGITGQLTTPMVTGTSHSQVPGEMSHGQFSADNNAANYGAQPVQSQYNMQQQNMSAATNPNSQNAMGGNMQQNPGHPGATYQVNYSNPAAQQMSSNRGKQNYGQHTPGVTKFNEMFPGVMGGMGGDLGFDPMTIAIQMNPANQQQAAMGQMQKLMNGNSVDRVLDPNTNVRNMQPATTGANAVSAAMYQPPVNQQNVSPSNQQPMMAHPGVTQPNQDYTNVATNQPNQAQQQVYGQVHEQQQQAYTALTGPPMIQNQPPQQYQQQYQQQQNVDPNRHQYQQEQQNMDPNAPDLPNLQSSYIADPNFSVSQQPPQSYSAQPTSAPDQEMIKEPIFPVDTSKNQLSTQNKYQKFYDYNTLGQPVEMLPARMYHQAPETNQQQTLSPQPITKIRPDQSRFTVKNTVSKTSLMGSRPVGRTPSRGQLQHIYNQYKGSHSYTQQNIRSPGQGATFSEGKINVTQANANQQRHVPVERVGGDTSANNQMANSQNPASSQPMGHTGDVPMPVDNKPHGDIVPASLSTKKTRNGLQDMVYTSYPTSAKWSFHGNNDRVHYAPGYRYRRA